MSKKTNKKTEAAKATNKPAVTTEKEPAKQPAAQTSEDIAAMLATMDPKVLKDALKAIGADKATENAKDKAANRLAKLRTYAVRQRAWAEAAIVKAGKAIDKAEEAELKLKELEERLGVDPATEEEVEAILAELHKSGRIAQVKAVEVEPSPADAQAAEAESQKADEAAVKAKELADKK